MNNRRVHGLTRRDDTGVVWEVVRYNRTGKWYLEPLHGSLPRRRVTVQEAVDAAILAYPDKPGGSRFDYLIKKGNAGD